LSGFVCGDSRILDFVSILMAQSMEIPEVLADFGVKVSTFVTLKKKIDVQIDYR